MTLQPMKQPPLQLEWTGCNRMGQQAFFYYSNLCTEYGNSSCSEVAENHRERVICTTPQVVMNCGDGVAVLYECW